MVAVVGRPNVGKSTFFNRALGRREAIVDDRPGVTRDRNFGETDWAGRSFYLVDTGGVVEDSDEQLERRVREQALVAVREADVVLFMGDAKTGAHPMDERIADELRRSGRSVLMVVNKVDNLPNDDSHLEFWQLGMGRPYPVCSASGQGFGDLLDDLAKLLPDVREALEDEVRVAVIGRPNVGKSSIVNRLLGEERALVSSRAGTTRDPVDSTIRYHGKSITFIDTAGLRRQARIKDSIEYYSRLRAVRVIQTADVCLVVVDASEGITTQDIGIAQSAWRAGCGVFVACNKWDLPAKETGTARSMEKKAAERAPFLGSVPFLFISALTGLRVRRTLSLALEVDERRRTRIPTAEVNEAISEILRRLPPPHVRGRPLKIRYGTQAQTRPPTFVLFSNVSDRIPTNYMRYLNNQIRARWGFEGVPIRIRMRSDQSGKRGGSRSSRRDASGAKAP